MLTLSPESFKRSNKIIPPNKNESHKITKHPVYDEKIYKSVPKSDKSRVVSNNNSGFKFPDRNNNTVNKNIFNMDVEKGYKIHDPNTVLWSVNSIETLKHGMNFINNHSLMQPLGHIVRYYINKNQSEDQEYKILMIGDVPSDFASRDVLILACICETRIKIRRNKSTVITDSMIYYSLGKIIREVVGLFVQHDIWELDYAETFMINTLTDILSFPSNPDARDYITTAYFLTKYIIKWMNISDNMLLKYLQSTYLKTQDIDLSILTAKQTREFMSVLQTKRRLYLRIFLLLSHILMKENIVNVSDWLDRNSNIETIQDLKYMLNNTLIEIFISITGYVIKNKDSR
jgi:hypothetical protein